MYITTSVNYNQHEIVVFIVLHLTSAQKFDWHIYEVVSSTVDWYHRSARFSSVKLPSIRFPLMF